MSEVPLHRRESRVLSAAERTWHIQDSQGQIPPRSSLSLSSELGTYKTVKARFWLWLSGQSP